MSIRCWVDEKKPRYWYGIDWDQQSLIQRFPVTRQEARRRMRLPTKVLLVHAAAAAAAAAAADDDDDDDDDIVIIMLMMMEGGRKRGARRRTGRVGMCVCVRVCALYVRTGARGCQPRPCLPKMLLLMMILL